MLLKNASCTRIVKIHINGFCDQLPIIIISIPFPSDTVGHVNIVEYSNLCSYFLANYKTLTKPTTVPLGKCPTTYQK